MGVKTTTPSLSGMVPRVRIELNNLLYTGIKVSILPFIILFLILSENGDLSFLTFFQLYTYFVFSNREMQGTRVLAMTFIVLRLIANFLSGLGGSFEWRVWKYCSQFSSRLMGHNVEWCPNIEGLMLLLLRVYYI